MEKENAWEGKRKWKLGMNRRIYFGEDEMMRLMYGI